MVSSTQAFHQLFDKTWYTFQNDMRGISKRQCSVVHVLALECSCPLCDLMKRMITHFVGIVDPEAIGEQMHISFDQKDVTRVTVQWNPLEDDVEFFQTRIYFRLFTEKGILPGIPASPVPPWSPRPDSAACLAFVDERLQECLATHGYCNRSATTPLPTRILDIGSEPGGPTRLLDAQGKEGKYAAMSYCWGTAKFIRTLGSNLADHATSIPANELPVVFLEAISLCHRLRIPFIWIDCLCIIQDSSSDWEVESAKMADYYANAFLTISATSSSNPTVPFLGIERDQKYATHKFLLRDSDYGPAGMVHARLSHIAQPEGEMEYDYGPLASRAWAWQETALSSRNLHFCHSELWWECRTHYVSETGTGDGEYEQWGQTKHMRAIAEAPYNNWTHVIEEYSRRRLTFETDRLPAISGAAARIHQLVKGEYYAGLWESNLVPGLCWQREAYWEVVCDVFEGLDYVAPSWSWASIPAPAVVNEVQDLIPMIKVEDTKTQVQGLNAFGRVLDGHLVATGPVVEFELSAVDGLSLELLVEDEVLLEEFRIDCNVVPAGDLLKRATREDKLLDFECMVPFLAIGYIPAGGQRGWKQGTFYLMALGASGREDGSYSRIGLLTIHNATGLDTAWLKGAVEKRVTVV